MAQSAPGFGGMFYKGVTTLNVYMLDFDLAQAKAVRAAIEAEFPDEKILGIRLVQGKYNVTQLLDWYDDLRPALAPVYDGLAGTDMDDGLNRLRVTITDEQFRQAAEDAVVAAGVPLEAVAINIGQRARLLCDQNTEALGFVPSLV